MAPLSQRPRPRSGIPRATAQRPRRKVDLRKTLFLLPNLITLSSIFCGFDSIRLTASGTDDVDFYRASVLLVFALLFDMLDGRVARLTKTQSAFGLQFDSLADIVSFGVAPALLVFKWSLYRLDTVGVVAAFLFCGMGAVRLARFNVLSMGERGAPTKPSKYILGLPVPGAAGILVSLILANHAAGGRLQDAEFSVPMAVLTLFLSFLMVSTIRFRSFKDLKLNGRTAAVVFLAVGSSVLVMKLTRPAFVLTWLLSLYVLIGLGESLFLAARKGRGPRDAQPSLPPAS